MSAGKMLTPEEKLARMLLERGLRGEIEESAKQLAEHIESIHKSLALAMATTFARRPEMEDLEGEFQEYKQDEQERIERLFESLDGEGDVVGYGPDGRLEKVWHQPGAGPKEPFEVLGTPGPFKGIFLRGWLLNNGVWTMLSAEATQPTQLWTGSGPDGNYLRPTWDYARAVEAT